MKIGVFTHFFCVKVPERYKLRVICGGYLVLNDTRTVPAGAGYY
jgi:hypothetical protein